MDGRRASAAVALAVLAMASAGCGSKDEKPDAGSTAQPLSTARLKADVGAAAAAAATRAGCRFGTPKQVEASHVANPSKDGWSSDPPTSGAHNADWLKWGVYDVAVEDRFALHNLEHGGVILWHGGGAGVEVAKAVQSTLSTGQKWIVSPREDLDGVVFAAWGRTLTCDAAAAARLDGKGSEAIARGWLKGAGSKDTPAEKAIPAYPGSITSPKPVQDLSIQP